MCIAIRIPTGLPKDWRDIRFNEVAHLPVATRSRRVKWFPWGRVRGEAGARLWPPGGWVDLELIRSGKWSRLHPRPVVIPCMGYQVRTNWLGWKDDSWYYPESDRALQGALVTRESEQRVYMVVQPNKEYGTKIMPRVVPFITDLVDWSAPADNFLASMDDY